MPLTLADAEPIMQYECHEGNYGLRNILSAARAEEKAADAGTRRGAPSASITITEPPAAPADRG
jgi:hypothetical protein